MVVGLVGLGLLLAVSVRASLGTRRLVAILLVLTTFAILATTLFGGDASVGPSVNLHPGAGIRSELGNVNQALGVVNILGNVSMFVPLGWLTTVLALHAARISLAHGLASGALAGLGLSLAIEVLQYFLGRASDVDDVLLNSAGALLGGTIGAALGSARRGRVAATASRKAKLSPHAPTGSSTYNG